MRPRSSSKASCRYLVSKQAEAQRSFKCWRTQRSTAPATCPSQSVSFLPFPQPLTTCSQAVSAVLHCETQVSSFQSVIGTYLQSKQQSALVHATKKQLRTEYVYSMSTIRVYNHVMHKLENLSAQVLDRRPAVRQLWSHAVNPFRRQLFNTLYANHRYVQAFAGGLPGGRLELPRMDNWSLGLWTSPNYEADRPSTLDLSRPALSQVHTVLLIDDSISMTERGIPSWGSGSSRWHQVGGLISDLAPIVTQYDPQGMDMHFLNHRNSQQGLRSSEDVQAIFSRVRPTGGAPLGRCVCTILGAYMATLRYERNLKPLNLVIITDGKVDDEFVLLSTLQPHSRSWASCSSAGNRISAGWQLSSGYTPSTPHRRNR